MVVTIRDDEYNWWPLDEYWKYGIKFKVLFQFVNTVLAFVLLEVYGLKLKFKVLRQFVGWGVMVTLNNS